MNLMLGFRGVLIALALVTAALAADGDWPRWRGPNDDGMARGDAPLRWSDDGTHRLESSRSRARLFFARGLGRPYLPHHSRAGPWIYRRTSRSTGSSCSAYDRKTGKLLWEKVARVATPHQPHHPQYGSFASNSPITDGKHVFAFFGSRGLYCYTLDGELVWQKDFGALRMYNNFGEGAWTALDGDKLVVVLDHEGESFLVALDKSTGRELWRTPRQGNTNWSGPYITSHNGRKQVIVSASREVVRLRPGDRQADLERQGPRAEHDSRAGGGGRNGLRHERLPQSQSDGDPPGPRGRPHRHRRHRLAEPARQLLHARRPCCMKASCTCSPTPACSPALTPRPASRYYQQERLPKPYNFKASPVGANGKLYLASENDDVIVVQHGREVRSAGDQHTEGPDVHRSPAILDGEIYLRGQNTLFCIR